MVYVTHDQVEAMTLADKIVVLNQGRIEQIGAPLELYANPDNLFVAGFIGSPKMNFMKAEVVETRPGGIVVSLVNRGGVRLALPITGKAPPQGDSITIGVRPEHFGEAGQGDADITVAVDVTEQLGSTSYVYAGISGEELIIERDPAKHYARNGSLTVSIDAARVCAFDSAGNRLR
jgi:lactose/L-arabinose transport system ATP-binding protein